VDWTAAAGGSDDQDFRKSLRTIQHLNIAGYTADDLRRFNCRVCTFRQHVGELVVVPPRCFVQAVVVSTESGQQPGPVLMLSWLAHNPATLEIATNDETEALRKETRALSINFHELVYRALEKRVSDLQSKLENGMTAPSADLGVLLRCMSKKLSSETVVMSDVERLTQARPPEPLLTPEEDGQLACGRCKTLIFGRYYRCLRCDDAMALGPAPFSLSAALTSTSIAPTPASSVNAAVSSSSLLSVDSNGSNGGSGGRGCKSAPSSARSSPVQKGSSGPVFCLECVVEGLRCDHLRDYRLCEVFPQANCRALVEKAMALFDRIEGSGLGEMIVGSVNTGLLSYGTVAHALVSMAMEDQRATCHQCKLAKPRFKVVLCTNTRSLTSKNKPRACCKKYCFSCLWNRYCIKQGDCLRQRNWCCPFCEGRCNCSACLRKKKVDPTAPYQMIGSTDLPPPMLPQQSHASGKKSPVPELVGIDARPQKLARMHDSSPRARNNTSSSSTSSTPGSTTSVPVVETNIQRYLARLGPFSQEYLARPLTPAEQATSVWTDAPDDCIPLFFLDDRIIYYVHKRDVRPY